MAKRIKIHTPLDESEDPMDRFAVFVSDLFGTPWFLGIFAGLIIVYLIWNIGAIPRTKPFDPSPFDMLDTILSIFAIVLSMSVLISQRRQRRMEKIREQVEFEINVRAENEITKILEMLHEMQQKMGIDKSDRDLEEMKKNINIEKLHDDIKQQTK